jgi:predicted nucleic acid-binding protein
MVRIVVDSQPIITLLFKQAKYERVYNFISNASENDAGLIMSGINFGEVYYYVLRNRGEEEARKLFGTLSSIPIEIIAPQVDAIIEAAKLKASKKMSYADCFAAALAAETGAAVLTGDSEFKEVEKEIKIIWV